MRDYIVASFREFQAAPRRVQLTVGVLMVVCGVGGSLILFGPGLAALSIAVAVAAPWLLKPYYRSHDSDDLLTVLKSLPDFDLPNRRGFGIAILGFVGVIAAELLVGIGYAALGPETPVATHESTTTPATTPGLWQIAVFFVWVAGVGPLVEEIVFRNGIQKLLTYRIGPILAILATSFAFAALHVPAYGGLAAGISLAVPLATIFAGSVIFGTLYWRTGTVLVPALAHGLFNGLAIGITVVIPALS